MPEQPTGPAGDEIDPYKLLGVSRDASASEIRWSYERLLNQAHRNGGIKKATALSQAYDILSQPHRREMYDRHGVAPLRERSPGAARNSVPWRGSSSPQQFSNRAIPVLPPAKPKRQPGISRSRRPKSLHQHRLASRRSWRVPTTAVFLLGISAGIGFTLWALGFIRLPQPIPTVGEPQRQVVCQATPAGPRYTFMAQAGSRVSCNNGAIPQIVQQP